MSAILSTPQEAATPDCASTADSGALVHGTLVAASHDQLVRSKLNVRKKAAPLQQLVALIRSQGLLQNLIGFWQTVDGARTGLIEIVAGGRRMDSIGELIACGEFPRDYSIPVLIVEPAEAVAISLAENSGREPMHPADLFDAMLALAEHGRSAEDIGLAFGLETLTVQRRLRLARVAPSLLALYRNDKVSLEQMTALAVTEDQQAQRQAWDSLGEGARTPHQLRRLLTARELNIRTDRVARFVGADAFKKAGGEIRRDLFSDDGDGYIMDVALLESLAVALRADHAFLSGYGRADLVRCAPDPKQQAGLDALARDIEAVARRPGQGADASLGQRLRVLRKRRAALEEALLAPDERCKPLAGALVYLDEEGEPQVRRHLIEPEDRAKAKVPTPPKVRAPHSERLTRVLTGHRTAALGAEMAGRPEVARAVLAAKLAGEALGGTAGPRGGGMAPGGVGLALSRPELADEVREGAAWRALEARRQELQARLAVIPDGQALLDWLLGQPQAVALELVAYAVACSLDTVTCGEGNAEAFARLAGAVQLDMKRWWQPTADSYFAHLPKARILEVVAEAVSPQAAVPLEKARRDEAGRAAERALAASGWLPAPLRGMVRPADQ